MHPNTAPALGHHVLAAPQSSFTHPILPNHHAYPPRNPVAKHTPHVKNIVNYRGTNSQSFTESDPVHAMDMSARLGIKRGRVRKDGEYRRSPRKRQKRSFVWNFFKETDDNPNVGLCLICKEIIPRGRNLARNTTNLRKHLEHRHPEQIRPHMESKTTRNSRPADSLRTNCDQQQQQQQHQQIQFPGSTLRAATAIGQVDSPEQSNNTNPQLNFSLMHNQAPETMQLTTDPITNLPSTAPQTTTNDRTVLTAANMIHGGPHIALNGRLSHRQMDDTSTDLPPNSERGFEEQNVPFTDPIGTVSPFQAKTVMDEKKTLPSTFDMIDHGAQGVRLAGFGKSGSNRTTDRNVGDMDEGNVGAIGTDVMLTKCREVDTSLLDFLAILDLPLAAVRSKGLPALFAGSSEHLQFPTLEKLRDTLLPTQVERLQEKVKAKLCRAICVVIIVELKETCAHLFCRYLDEEMAVKHVCLGVIPQHFIQDDGEVERVAVQDASVVDDCTTSFANYNGNRVAHQRNDKRSLIEHIDWAMEQWRIRDKVIAVVLPQKSTLSSFQPGHEESGSSTNSRHPRPALNTRPTVSSNVYSSLGQILVVHCLSHRLHHMVNTIVIQNVQVERCFIRPVSNALYSVLSMKEYLQHHTYKAPPATVSLPLAKHLSLEKLLDALEYFSENFELIQTLVKKHLPDTSTTMELSRMTKTNLEQLQDVLLAFVDALNVSQACEHGSPLLSRHISCAIPAMKELSGKLETLHRNCTEDMKDIIKNAYSVANGEYNALLKDDLYLCATLLDPYFKGSFFDEGQLTRAKSFLISECESEAGARQNAKVPTSATGKNGIRSSSDMSTTQGSMDQLNIMEDFMQDRNMVLGPINEYLSEPTTTLNNDLPAIFNYWRANTQKWPILARVALKYALIPTTCKANRKSGVLGDYRDGMEHEGHVENHALTFMRNNLLLVDGLSMFSNRPNYQSS